jgi:hypothetical protein
LAIAQGEGFIAKMLVIRAFPLLPELVAIIGHMLASFFGQN